MVPPIPTGRLRGANRLLGVPTRQICQSLISLSLVLVSAKPLITSAQAPAAGAQSEVVLGDRYKAAMEDFGNGEYKKAVASLQEILSKATDGPGWDSVRYSLAAALFNNKEYKKSREKFEEYLKLYPQGAKVADAQMGVGQCQLALGDKAGAAKTFALVVSMGGANKEQAILSQAALLKTLQKNDEAAGLLQPILASGVRSPESVEGALLLASIEVAKGNRDRAFQIVNILYNRPDIVNNPIQLNGLTFEVGDAYLKAKDVKKALSAYALVRKKEDVLALHNARIQALNRRIEANAATAKAEPARSVDLLEANNILRSYLEAAKGTLEEIEKTPSNLIPLRLRQARCYQDEGRQWEAVLLFESALNATEKAGREDLLYSLGAAHAELENTDESVAVLELYSKEFPKGKNADSALYLEGTQLLRKERYEAAVPVLSRLVEGFPKSKAADRAQFYLGNTYFALAQYPKAIEVYEKYAQQYPTSDHIEEVTYRIALCHFSSGVYAKALPAFESYSKANPGGAFAADALYRTGFCYFAAKQYPDVIQICDAWETKFGYDSLRGEVLSLKADALAGKEQRMEAVAVYRQAIEKATTDQVAQYALFEANKQLQKLGRWDLSVDLFQEFLNTHPEHPAATGAYYWLTRAMIKQGKTVEAKQYLAEKIYTLIGDRSKDAVEQLLSQLAQLCSKRVPTPAASPDASVAPTVSDNVAEGVVVPPAPAYDGGKELASFLDPSKMADAPLVKARLRYAEAELARMTKRPKDAQDLLDQICDQTPANALGASLLAQCGDRLMARGQKEKAKVFFQELMKAFPHSELRDYAYNGMGQFALEEGKAEEALRWFDDAIDKIGASTKLKDVVYGRGRALLALQRFDEAKVSFEQVAASREWKGETTAEAVYLLGEVFFQKGDYSAAVQYFQRVFVAYQRYHSVVAKAYIRAGDCFEKLAYPEKAQAHYRELLRKEKLSEFPEYATAKKRLNNAPEK
ncbi:MAG: tetratricopeptide repeat protein [Verrucomicrobiota bacterium]